ncbi:MAG: hypothetical protein KatS3mg087_2198 [Patescibacteria group bacterium]|nr:MAG: hypothetical protein KatS3mg087_2198 [Patescibacteria group bacterium]
MKFIIRQGFFETNSSSTHVIVIARNKSYKKIDTLKVEEDEYGWGVEILSKYWHRANYFYTACVQHERMDLWEKAKSVLLKSGYVNSIVENKDTEGGYIDHQTDSLFFIEKICESDETILDYFLNDSSMVIIANDNGYMANYYVYHPSTVLYHDGQCAEVEDQYIEL